MQVLGSTKARQRFMNRAYYTRDERMEIKELQALMKRTANRQLQDGLSPTNEANLKNLLMQDPMQSGEKMFSLMAWATGGRAKELLTLQWRDVKPISDAPETGYAITIPNSRSSTKGTFREIPLGAELTEFILRRKDELSKLSFDGLTTPDDLFVFCDGNNYNVAGDEAKMIAEARKALLDAGVHPDALRMLELTIKYLEDGLTLLDEYDVIYMFRRDLGLDMTDAGVAKEEVGKLLDIPKPD